jgi:hypothetical protein
MKEERRMVKRVHKHEIDRKKTKRNAEEILKLI